MTNQAQLSFAIKAVNEANAALKSVGADLTSVEKAASSADKAAGGFGSALGGVAKIAGGFVLAKGLLEVPGALMSASDRARDLELQMKKATTVFGDQMPIVQEWASKNAAAMGMSKAQATNLAAGLQDLLVPMGFTREEATKLSTKTLGLAGALSEWSGGAKSASEVSDILTKAYLGETDGLKALGISISAADVAQRLHEKGQDKLTGAALQQAQALAIQEMAFEKSTDAQTAFANGAGSAARKQAEMKAKIEELKDKMSLSLAPIITQVTGLLASGLIPAVDFTGRVFEKGVLVVRNFMIALTGDRAAFDDASGAFLVAAKAGMALHDAIEFMMPKLEALAVWFTDNPERMQVAGVIIGTVLAAAFLAWAVSAGAAAVATIAAAAPVIALVAAIALLAAGVFLLIKHWDDITAKYPALGAATDAVKAKFQELVSWITGSFVPGVQAVYTGVKDAVDAAVGYVRDHWDDIKAIIEPALQALAIIVDTQVKLWKTAIETVLGVIKGLVDVFMGVFTGDWDRAWGGVKQIVESVWNGIKGSIETVIGAIKGLAPLIQDAGEALGKALFEGLKSALSATAGFAGDVGQAVLEAVKSVINTQVIDRLNSVLQFTIPIKGLPDIHVDAPDIPRLAAGGIVMKPTLALIGEAGPEAVIPLGKGGGVGGVTVVIQGSVYGVDDLMYQMDRALKRAGQQGLVA